MNVGHVSVCMYVWGDACVNSGHDYVPGTVHLIFGDMDFQWPAACRLG